MQKPRTTTTLILADLAVAGLALFYHLSLRVRVLEAFAAYGTEVPPATRIALSAWLMPLALGTSAALVVAASVLPIRRSRAMRILQLAVTVLASVVVFAVLAALVPIFRP